MALRWTGAAMIEAAKGFRRLKAHNQLPSLRAALLAHQAECAVGPALTLSARLHSLLNQTRPPPSLFQLRAGHPPVVLTLWLSMIPAVGWACLPSISRAVITRSWLIVARRPLSRQA